MPADTPSPSPLNSEERAKFERVARILAANPSPSGLDGYGGWAIGFLRALALADSMAARVSDLEAAAQKVVTLAVPGSVTHDHVCREGCLRTAIESLEEVLRAR